MTLEEIKKKQLEKLQVEFAFVFKAVSDEEVANDRYAGIVDPMHKAQAIISKICQLNELIRESKRL